jgi:hypothetical protein
MDNFLDTPIESPSSKSEEDDPLDPRIQIELERLNHANEAINHLELQLDVFIRKIFSLFLSIHLGSSKNLKRILGCI